jgi:hypothetical protein
LGNLPSTILWTWPCHVSWFCSISYIPVSSSPICCLIITFLILSFLDILYCHLKVKSEMQINGHHYSMRWCVNTFGHWTFGRREKSFFPPRIRKPFLPVRSQVTVRTTFCRLCTDKIKFVSCMGNLWYRWQVGLRNAVTCILRCKYGNMVGTCSARGHC